MNTLLLATNFSLAMLELLLIFPMFVIGLLGFVFWVWMLIDCLINEPSDGNDKLIWVLILIFTNLVGALIYFFVQRPRRKGAGGP